MNNQWKQIENKLYFSSVFLANLIRIEYNRKSLQPAMVGPYLDL